MSALFGKGPTLTYPGRNLSISMTPTDAKKTNACSSCAEISGIYTKGCFVGFFFPQYFHCSWQRSLDPSHNGKLKMFNVNQIISKKQLFFKYIYIYILEYSCKMENLFFSGLRQYFIARFLNLTKNNCTYHGVQCDISTHVYNM